MASRFAFVGNCRVSTYFIKKTSCRRRIGGNTFPETAAFGFQFFDYFLELGDRDAQVMDGRNMHFVHVFEGHHFHVIGIALRHLSSRLPRGKDHGLTIAKQPKKLMFAP
jgi:hypothetical protein